MNWGLINFQKSRNSSSVEIHFTINIGVCSYELRRLVGIGVVDIKSKPGVDECQWKQRIGFLMPNKDDYWWQISLDTAVEGMAKEIQNVLNVLAIPKIMSHISDDDLISEWMAGRSEGITEFQRYVYLSTLLKLNNRPELSKVIEEMKTYSKGKPIENSMNVHLKDLETYE